MNRHVGAVLGICLLITTMPLHAHHSLYAHWLTEEYVQITGVVKSINIVNPHSEMIVEVTEESGEISEWRVGGGAPHLLRRLGWDPDALPIGTRVTVEAHPSRQPGVKALAQGKIFKEDGTVLYFCDTENCEPCVPDQQ